MRSLSSFVAPARTLTKSTPGSWFAIEVGSSAEVSNQLVEKERGEGRTAEEEDFGRDEEDLARRTPEEDNAGVRRLKLDHLALLIISSISRSKKHPKGKGRTAKGSWLLIAACSSTVNPKSLPLLAFFPTLLAFPALKGLSVPCAPAFPLDAEARDERLASRRISSVGGEECFLLAEAARAWTAGVKMARVGRWEEVGSESVPRRVEMFPVTCEGVSKVGGEREELAHVDLSPKKVLDAALNVFERKHAKEVEEGLPVATV